jgi:hypothetical protein
MCLWLVSSYGRRWPTIFESVVKNDTQHLDFLISQYVDQTLDGANRRVIEQKILSDSVAGALFKEHCDVQEVLDDWGNRLPMIDWDQFDQTLAARLEQEASQVIKPARAFRPWSRALAAAAALFIAATIGYTWHAVSTSGPRQLTNNSTTAVAYVVPEHSVAIHRPATTGPAIDSVTYERPVVAQRGNKVQFPPPADHGAPLSASALAAPPAPGLQNMPSNPGSVVGSAVQPVRKPERSDLPVAE